MKGLPGPLTQMFTQTPFLRQLHEVNFELRNEQPKSIAVADSIWVICTNIKMPSMNLEFLSKRVGPKFTGCQSRSHKLKAPTPTHTDLAVDNLSIKNQLIRAMEMLLT